MAAYAALLSLNRVIEQILQTTHLLNFLKREQIEALQQNIIFLQEFLEQYHHRRREEEEIENLERKIAAAAYKAEDVIESCVVDQIRGKLDADDVIFFHQQLQRVLEGMGSIREGAMKIKETVGMEEYQRPRLSTEESGLPRPAHNGEDSMVGFDDDLVEIMDKLTGQQRSSLQIISIVGMGGIGKTTLAKNIYENPFIVQHFHIRAWITISQEYRVREILIGVLREISVYRQQWDENLVEFIGKVNEKSDDELGDKLHKCLSGMRYIIVMDDIWSIEAWNDIRMFFPDNNNGSRILVTTRLSNLFLHFHSCSPYQLDFLDEGKSWTLFCKIVFADKVCPPEMEAIGKKIVRNCRGLPLAVVTVGGLLAKSNMTKEHWENVAEDMNSMVNSGNDGDCMKALSLSYNHLPVHLKPCFLYMGTFPEDSLINVSRLTKLWVAEGFLKRVADRSLEEVAMDYLTDLVDRNLILARKYGSSGTLKLCMIHDLLRDLCLKEAHKDKFFCVTRLTHRPDNIPENIRMERRLIIHKSKTDVLKNHSRILNALSSASFTRSLMCRDFNKWACMGLPVCFELLRIFDANEFISGQEILNLVNSRYLAICDPFLHTDPSDHFKSLSRLWNLQTVIVTHKEFHGPIYLPSEIWEMRQLRHLKIDDVGFLPDPPHPYSSVLENLQTLSTISDLRISEEILYRLPNLMKLGLCYDNMQSSDSCIWNLVKLLKLRSLFLRCGRFMLQSFAFPRSLKKLTLLSSGLPWEDMTIIGSLPYLEVLKLKLYAFLGPEWNPVEGEFLKLKFLLIEDSDLTLWSADNSHFPELETLVLSDVYELKEIPSGIGDIPTLRLIRISYCRDSAAASAKQIQEEQKDLGNEDIRVEVFKCGNWK